MPDETAEFEDFLRPPGWTAEKADLIAENLRLRHALTVALADYETMNGFMSTFNIPMHPFTLTPQLIVEALASPRAGDVRNAPPPSIAVYGEYGPPPEMDSGGAG